MVESYQATAGQGGVTRPLHAPYDKRKLSYANTFTNPWKANTIRALEWAVDTGDGVVVVTDLYGGSPSNLSLLACQPENRRILYGMNLPMLIKLAKSRQKDVPDAVKGALEAGRKYIDSVNVKPEPL